MRRSVAIFVFMALAACSKGSDCRKALAHAREIAASDPDAPKQAKTVTDADFDKGVAACEKSQPDAKMLDCILAAKTFADLVPCDAMRR